MVVPLNHLGIELHKNNRYKLLCAQRKEGCMEGEAGTNSFYFSLLLQLSSFQEQGADSRVWRVDCALCIMSYLSVVPLDNCLIYYYVNCFQLSQAD